MRFQVDATNDAVIRVGEEQEFGRERRDAFALAAFLLEPKSGAAPAKRARSAIDGVVRDTHVVAAATTRLAARVLSLVRQVRLHLRKTIGKIPFTRIDIRRGEAKEVRKKSPYQHALDHDSPSRPFYLSVVDVDGAGSVAGRGADGHVFLDDLGVGAIVLLDAHHVILRAFGQIKPRTEGREFQHVVDEGTLGHGQPVLPVVIDSLHVIQIRVRPIHVLVGVIQGNPARIHDLVKDQTRAPRPVQRRPLQLGLRAPIGEEEPALGGIDGDAARILQFAVDHGQAGDAVRSAEEDAVHDVVDEIPIGAQPIVGHLLHVIQALREDEGPLDGGIGHRGAVQRAQAGRVRSRRRHFLLGGTGDPADGPIAMIDVHGADGVAFQQELGLGLLALEGGGHDGIDGGEKEQGRLGRRLIDGLATSAVGQAKAGHARTLVRAGRIATLLIARREAQDGQVTQFQVAFVQIETGGAVGRLTGGAVATSGVERLLAPVRAVFGRTAQIAAVQSLVRMVRAVGDAVAQRRDGDAAVRPDAAMQVGRTEAPAGRQTADGLAHFQLLVRLIAAVVVAVASPPQRNAVLLDHALKLGGSAGGRRTLGRLVLVRPVEAVGFAIAFPGKGNALELTVGLEAGAAEERVGALGRRFRGRRRRPVGIPQRDIGGGRGETEVSGAQVARRTRRGLRVAGGS